MTLNAERRLAHADVLRARGPALPPGGLPAEEILDSWGRCLQAGLDFAAPAPLVVVGAADLARRREQTAVARRLAQAELETLAQQIAGSDFLLAFADRDGVILDCYADHRFAAGSGDAAIVVGRNWSEALCGTNGLGTALTRGRPTSVTGPDHYFLGLGDLSCCAAPVHDARGEVVGVLDASSHFDSRQRHTQALVQMAATHVENGLLLHQMREHLVLAVHPRPEFLRTLSAGLLAFDASGALVALNARASQLLQGLAPACGSSFDALFGEPFDGLLARLQRGADLRLRDRLGSVLSARSVSRPTAPTRGLEPPTRTPAASGAARVAAPMSRVVDPTALTADPKVAEACRMVDAAVRLKAPILIQGETGTGKELLARHAHRASGRRGAFVPVNCGALPAELFEAELFGYVGGSFTGARREGSVGLIASADGGTLLLDEVRELPLRLQAALLRFLDDGLVRPVGGTAARLVNVQLLAASNADLDDEVAAQRFRADLLYRLNTVRVVLPPLRARRDFRQAVLGTLAAIDGAASIADDAIERLAAHGWPGNFRELRAVLTRALLAGDRQRLRRVDVDGLLPAAAAAPASALQQAAAETIRREFERSGRSVSRTSRNLGISRTTVYRHLGELAPAAVRARAGEGFDRRSGPVGGKK